MRIEPGQNLNATKATTSTRDTSQPAPARISASEDQISLSEFGRYFQAAFSSDGLTTASLRFRSQPYTPVPADIARALIDKAFDR